MSHSNFSFLMALHADAFLGDEDERREFIESEFFDKFGSRLHGDSQVHYIAVFYKDGTYLAWPTSDPGSFADIPDENRWQAVWRFALQCVAVDFRLFGATPWTIGNRGNAGNEKISELTFNELLSEIYRQIPSSLSELYSSLQDNPASLGTIPDEFSTAEHDRRKRALMFEALRDSNHVPFTRWRIVTPYEYRAFDLTLGEEPNAILITDIHT